MIDNVEGLLGNTINLIIPFYILGKYDQQICRDIVGNINVIKNKFYFFRKYDRQTFLRYTSDIMNGILIIREE